MGAALQVARQVGVHYHDLHLPTIMRAAYGKRPPKFIMMVRNPIDRLHSAFYGHEQYKTKYGKDPDGLTKWVGRCSAAAAGWAVVRGVKRSVAPVGCLGDVLRLCGPSCGL